MGMTHLLGDGVPALSRSGPRFPLLRPGQAELFGFDPGELDTGEWTRLTGLGLHAAPAANVRQDPAGRAAAALSRLEREADAVIVHFDVDVLDTGAFPLANSPHFAGLTLEEAGACLGILLPEREAGRPGRDRGQPRSRSRRDPGAGPDRHAVRGPAPRRRLN